MKQLEKAYEALREINKAIRPNFPVGTKINARKGRGLATYTVTGYPDNPESVKEAFSVLTEGKNRAFVIDTRTVVESEKE